MLAARCAYLTLTDRAWGLYTVSGGAMFSDRIVDDLTALLGRRGVTLQAEARMTAIDHERGHRQAG